MSKFTGSKIRSVRHPKSNTCSRSWLPFSVRCTRSCLLIEITHLFIAFVCVDGRGCKSCVPAAPIHDVWRRLFAPHALRRLHSLSSFGLVRGCTCSSRQVLLGRHVRRASSTRTPHEPFLGATSRFKAVLQSSRAFLGYVAFLLRAHSVRTLDLRRFRRWRKVYCDEACRQQRRGSRSRRFQTHRFPFEGGIRGEERCV